MAQLTRETLKYMGAVKGDTMPDADRVQRIAEIIGDSTDEFIDAFNSMLVDGGRDELAALSNSDIEGADKLGDFLQQFREAQQSARNAKGALQFALYKIVSEMKRDKSKPDPRGIHEDWQNP